PCYFVPFLFFSTFLLVRLPRRSPLFPYRRSSDLRRFARADARPRRAVPLDAPGPRHARGRPEPAGGATHGHQRRAGLLRVVDPQDRKSTRLNSSHEWSSYAVFCLKTKTNKPQGLV